MHLRSRYLILLASTLGCCRGVRVADAASIRNGSFESGDFTGWTATDLPTPFQSQAVVPGRVETAFSGFLGPNLVIPSHGRFAASNGFDGDGPGTISLAQNIGVIADGDILSFDYRAGWDLVNFGATLDRFFQVFIESPFGGTPPLQQLILTAESGTDTAGGSNSDTGPLTARFDISPLAGLDARLVFVWTVPENFSGPANAQLDNVRIIPEPVSVVLLALCFIAGALSLAASPAARPTSA